MPKVCPKYNLDKGEQRLAILCTAVYLLVAALWGWHQYGMVRYSREHPTFSYNEGSFIDEVMPEFNITIIPLTNFNRRKYNCHMGRSQFQIYFVGGNRSVYIDTDQLPIDHLKWHDFGGDSIQTGLYYTVLPLPFRFAFRRRSTGAVESYQILNDWWLEGLKCLNGSFQPTQCPRESSRVDFYYTFHENVENDSAHCMPDIRDLFLTSADASEVLQKATASMTFDLVASPGSIVPILARSFRGGMFIPANPTPGRGCRTVLPVSSVETNRFGKVTHRTEFEDSMRATVQGVSFEPVEGFCGMTMIPLTKKTATYYAQYRPLDALTHWFTVMHACLAVVFCLFKSSPMVPYYYRQGAWADAYRKLLDGAAQHDLELQGVEDPGHMTAPGLLMSETSETPA